MSSFEEIFLPERLKKKDETKKETPIPVTPRRSHTTTPRTAQMSEEKLASVLGQVFDQKIQVLTKTLENQAIPQTSELEQLGLIHTFTRENLTSFIGRRGTRGTKLCELRDYFFGSATAGEIDKEVQKLRKEGLIQKNRSGWMSLRKKTMIQ